MDKKKEESIRKFGRIFAKDEDIDWETGKRKPWKQYQPLKKVCNTCKEDKYIKQYVYWDTRGRRMYRDTCRDCIKNKIIVKR